MVIRGMMALIGLSLAGPAASQGVIDLFDYDFAATSMGQYLAAGVPGGEVDWFMLAVGMEPPAVVSVNDGAALIAVEGDGSRVQVIYDGIDGSSGNAFDLPLLDLTAGQSDAFLVHVEAIQGAVRLEVRVWEAASDFLTLTRLVTEPGLVVFPYSEFVQLGSGADLTVPKAMALLVRGVDDTRGTVPTNVVRISSFRYGRSDPVFADRFDQP